MARRRKHHSRRSVGGRFARNPAPRRIKARKRRSASRTIVVNSNPAPARRRKRRAHYAVNPIRRRYKRNPIAGRSGKGKVAITSQIGPAVAAGLGGVAADALMGYAAFLPAMLTTGKMRYFTKAVLSTAAGYAVGKFASQRIGNAMVLGGLAISIHDATRDMLSGLIPGMRFAEYMAPADGLGYYNAGAPAGMGQYMNELDYGGDQSGGMGAYDSFAQRDFGVPSYITGR